MSLVIIIYLSIHTDSVFLLSFHLNTICIEEHKFNIIFFPSTTGNSISLSKENEILIQYKKLKKSYFLLRKLKEGKIKEREELYRNHRRNWRSRTRWLRAVAMEIEHQLLSYPILSKP